MICQKATVIWPEKFYVFGIFGIVDGGFWQFQSIGSKSNGHLCRGNVTLPM